MTILEMKRREFIALLGGAAATWPIAARAQPERVRHVGVLVPQAEDDPVVMGPITIFRQELERLGWVDGRNTRITYRFSSAGAGQFPQLAKEMVALRPDVIFA